jgi:hypothetical protein
VERLYSITGQPPALWDLPEGCRFAPRCEFAMERCGREYPRSFAVEGDSAEHVASCWLLEGAPVNRAKDSELRRAGGEPDAVAMEGEANGTGRRVGGSFG